MNRTHAPTRREFLLLAATLGVPLVPWHTLLGLRPDPPGDSSASARRLVGLLRQRSSARAIGEAYLEAMPCEARVEPLVDSILRGLEGGVGALRSAEDELRRRLARAVERDFEQDETVCLEGWIVSRTEARLCALAALA